MSDVRALLKSSLKKRKAEAEVKYEKRVKIEESKPEMDVDTTPEIIPETGPTSAEIDEIDAEIAALEEELKEPEKPIEVKRTEDELIEYQYDLSRFEEKEDQKKLARTLYDLKGKRAALPKRKLKKRQLTSDESSSE